MIPYALWSICVIIILVMENQRDQIQNRLIKDYEFVCWIGVVNSCFDIAAGVVWENYAVDEGCIVFPRYGGYLILIAFSKIFIMVYLLTFYCRGRTDHNYLRCLRFIVSTIAFLISIAIIIMVIVKLIRQIQSKSLRNENQHAAIITASVTDLIVTVYSTPAYLFLAVSHFLNLGRKQESRVQEPVLATERAEELFNRISDRLQMNEMPQAERQIEVKNKILSSQHLL